MASGEQQPGPSISEHRVTNDVPRKRDAAPSVRWRRRLSRNRRRDLRTQPFPVIQSDDWRDPDKALATLYRHVEARALETMDWYLIDKRYKKIGSRMLRACAIALVAIGGLQPLLSVARSGQPSAAWGYVLLALAAACVGFDRFFGLSSGWMRDMTSTQAVQRLLEQLQFDWTTLSASVALGLADSRQVLDRLDLLKAFSKDLLDIVHHETSDWIVEFQSSLAQHEISGRDWSHAWSTHTNDGAPVSGVLAKQEIDIERAQHGSAASPPRHG